MAEQIGIGTLLGSDFAVTGYADADGRRLIRVKSSLRKLKWKRAATMKNSREAARHFGAASSIAGGIWANVPGGLRRLMDSGAFNRLVATCRMLQEWDGNVGDFDGFRNLELSEGALGPHRVMRLGDSWGVVGISELMREIDLVTVVSDERLKRKDESLNQSRLLSGLQSRKLSGSQDFQKLGGTGGFDESRWLSGGELRDESLVVERLRPDGYREEGLKRRRRIRRMAGVVEESDFRHGPGRKWDRVEEVYGQEENPRVRFWEGRGMFDYGRVVPPRIELAQRFLRSPYVSCWPFEGNLGKLDNLRNLDGAWTSSVRPDRRYRVWVQACEIGRVREAGGRAGARFQLQSVGGSPLGSGGFVSPWTVVRGDSRALAGSRASGSRASGSARVAGFDEGGGMRVESFLAVGLAGGFDERGKIKDECLCLASVGAEGIGFELVGHGGTGVFVVIAGIEVAEKRGRHWVRLPWCCKVRVVDVVEQSLKQNSQDSLNLQDSKSRSRWLSGLSGSQDPQSRWLSGSQESGVESGCLDDVGMDGAGMPDMALARMGESDATDSALARMGGSDATDSALARMGESDVVDLVWAAMVVEFKGIQHITSGLDWVGLEATMGWIALGLGP